MGRLETDYCGIKKIQTDIYDFYCSVVHVWQYIIIYRRNVCNDKNMAGQGNDGRHGNSGTFSVSDLFSTRKGKQGNVDVFCLRLSIRSFCNKHILYVGSDSGRSRGDSDRHQK